VLYSFCRTFIEIGDSLLNLPESCDDFLKFRTLLDTPVKNNDEVGSVFTFQSKYYYYHISCFSYLGKTEYELIQIEAPLIKTILPVCNGASYNKCTILDCTSDLIWLTNKNQQLINYNKAFKRYYIRIFKKEPYKGVLLSTSDYNKLFGVSISFAEIIFGKNMIVNVDEKGIKQMFEINFNPIYSDDNNQVTHISACAKNISQELFWQQPTAGSEDQFETSASKKEKEQKLKELKSHFVSMASHEFRTPLAVMQSITELLEIQLSKSTHPDKEELNENVINLKNEMKRMNLLIDDILMISKIENEKITVNKEVVNIIEEIETVIGRNNSLQSDGRKVVFNNAIQAVNLSVDKTLINHVFDNLISNAFKYSQGKPSPVISTAIKNNNLMITIKDFGIGIPENQKQSIFQTFFRASNARRIKGTGLGLFIVKSFIELHNATVIFNSAEGEGSEFVITFPLN
jgi:signal transduction histidine kinase